ncbi:hypothetical protein [Bacillus sp. JCM 19041]|uniref:hypothetical protein n=1 Tax=Bacillus sp. JCM 19041 TaxID=1460637 RepID=UPI0012E20EC3
MPTNQQSNKKGPTFEQQQKPAKHSNDLLPLPPKPPCAPCQGKQQSFSMPANGGFAQQNAQAQPWMQAPLPNAQAQPWMQAPPPKANMPMMQMPKQQGNHQQYDPYSGQQQPSFYGNNNQNSFHSQNNQFMPNQQEFNPYQQNNTHQESFFPQHQQYMMNQQMNSPSQSMPMQSNWPTMPMNSSQVESGFAPQNMNNYGMPQQELNYHQQNLMHGQSNQGYQPQQMNMPMYQQSFNRQVQVPQQQPFSLEHNQAPRMMPHNEMYQQGLNPEQPIMQEYEPRQQVNAYEEKDSQE